MQIENLKLRVEADDIAWQATNVRGVQIFPLSPAEILRGSDPRGDATVLIRMEPGRGYPAHRHLGVEQVLILQGGYRDARGEHTAGSYLRYEANSVHAPIALGEAAETVGPGNPACVLLAFAQGGIELVGRD